MKTLIKYITTMCKAHDSVLAAMLIFAVLIILVCGISFLLTAALVKLGCYAFDFEFTWLKALVIWIIMFIINLGRK